jgi:hypothetical protein
MWLFLDLVAAESLVVLMSSLFPNFVISLALTAFANGLWMSVGGFLVTPEILNVFWRYVFHYIDYQVGLPGYCYTTLSGGFACRHQRPGVFGAIRSLSFPFKGFIGW